MVLHDLFGGAVLRQPVAEVIAGVRVKFTVLGASVGVYAAVKLDSFEPPFELLRLPF